jgi:brefeldin A-inhibited guanine nucleotide-exchange protein
MLNTDLHNARVKRKMTRKEFIKNNQRLDDISTLSEEFLGSIFDQIAENEIKMHKVNGASDPKSPQALNAVTLGETMAIKTEVKFKKSQRGASNTNGDQKLGFISASNTVHVKPMFELIWMSILTGLGTLLQETEDFESIQYCLQGIFYAVRISCTFDIELAKQALLSTLSKYAHFQNLDNMKQKNLEAVKVYLQIAYLAGDFLGTNWQDVMNCVSQLDRLDLLGSTDVDSAPNRSREVSNNSSKGTKPKEIKGPQSLALSVDKIFEASAKLSVESVVHFVKALCIVSWEEITYPNQHEHPRMHCLQKIIEVCYYNMNRVRMEWNNIWVVISDHFKQVGCHPNPTVAFFAIDKLRQLAIKFMDLEELPNFRFQKSFLQPFEEILKNNGDHSIKEMCLICIEQIIKLKPKQIKSGWKTLCRTLLNAAKESNGNVQLI